MANDQKSAGELARQKIYAGLPDDDVALALAICQKYGFDPLLKHLVLIPSNFKDEATGKWLKRYNAYVTRDGLLHVAHTSGTLDGLDVILGKDELGEWAEAAVYRKDMTRPFRYKVYLSEYSKEPKGAWKTHPHAMLTKTAEVFALRRAFDVALTPIEEMGFEENKNLLPLDPSTETNTPIDPRIETNTPTNSSARSVSSKDTGSIQLLEYPSNKTSEKNREDPPYTKGTSPAPTTVTSKVSAYGSGQRRRLF